MSIEQKEALDYLRTELQEGSTVYAIVTHVARSGASRSVQTLIARGNEIFDISWSVASALDLKFDRTNGGVKVSGGGMDMAFSVVYDLGRTLGLTLNKRSL